MSNEQFTPGIWEYWPSDATGQLSSVLCPMVNTYGNHYVAECPVDADAKLISVAPDMYRLLRMAVTRVKIANERDGDPILSAWLPDAEEVLALANEGRMYDPKRYKNRKVER